MFCCHSATLTPLKCPLNLSWIAKPLFDGLPIEFANAMRLPDGNVIRSVLPNVDFAELGIF